MKLVCVNVALLVARLVLAGKHEDVMTTIVVTQLDKFYRAEIPSAHQIRIDSVRTYLHISNRRFYDLNLCQIVI